MKELTYIIFECKSSNFDINKINSNKALYKFVEKSIKNVIKLKLDKKIYYINLSLYNIEYLQTQMQKIKIEYANLVNVYSIC